MNKQIAPPLVFALVVGATLATDTADVGYAENCDRGADVTACPETPDPKLHVHQHEADSPLLTREVTDALPPRQEFQPMQQHESGPWYEEELDSWYQIAQDINLQRNHFLLVTNGAHRQAMNEFEKRSVKVSGPSSTAP